MLSIGLAGNIISELAAPARKLTKTQYTGSFKSELL